MKGSEHARLRSVLLDGTSRSSGIDGTMTRPDLHTSLLREGIALARSGGAAAVSLRSVQRRAGVSHSAAYRHFADREALLNAISDHAAEQMADRMRSAIAAIDPRETGADRARARFRATGEAYLDFALSEPGLFAVAFQGRGSAGADRAAGPAGSPPFQLLVECLDDLVETGTLVPERRPYADIAARAAVHGLAVLIWTVRYASCPQAVAPPPSNDSSGSSTPARTDRGEPTSTSETVRG